MEEFEIKKVVMVFVVLSVLLASTLGFCMTIGVNAYIDTDLKTGYRYYITYTDSFYKGARLNSIMVFMEVRDRDDKIVKFKGGNSVSFHHFPDGSWHYGAGKEVKTGTLAYKILRYSLEVLGERY